MRPLTLRLIGFRSYADARVDFSHHSLVVVSGDTGSGKTSLLDGVCFALYGKTPELGGARELLSLGAAHGEVELGFSTGGGSSFWRVTRRFGPQAPEPTNVLERLDEDGRTIDRVTGHAPVNARIVALIGMTFEAFTSAVLLAQGRFAQFIQAQPKDRDNILRQLFGVTGLETVRTAAIAARDAHEGAAEVLDAERARLGDHGTGARNDAALRLRAASARQAGLSALRPLMDLAARARGRVGEATASLVQIRRAGDELGRRDHWAEIAGVHAAAHAEVERTLRRRDDATRTLDDAVDARDRLRSAHGGSASELAAIRALADRAVEGRAALPRTREALLGRRHEVGRRRHELTERQDELAELTRRRDDARALLDAHDDVTSAAAVAQAAEREVDDARAARQRAHEAAREATDTANTADDQMDRLRSAFVAAGLRNRMSVGDSCPVCGQAVHVIPPGPLDDLDEIEARVASLQQRATEATAELTELDVVYRAAVHHHDASLDAVEQARIALRSLDPESGAPDREAIDREIRDIDLTRTRAAERIAELATWIEQETGSLVEADRRLQRDESELAELLASLGAYAEIDDPVTSLDAAFRDVEAMEQSVLLASEAVARCTADVRDAEAAAGRIERERVAPLRQALTIVATRLGLDPPAPDEPPAGLAARAEEMSRQAEWAAQDAQDRIREATAEADEIDVRVGERARVLGVDPAGDFSATLRAAQHDLQRARETMADTERSALTGRRLEAQATAERRQAAVAAQLAQDLQANRFPRFLLSRFHERLARGATQRLLALSNGAYSFAGEEPEPLAVVDHRRGHRRRSAATLSGGERFLASLSLALAMSDIASGTEGRLECLFLDEGFSTLDADSLELAITGVERMADDGRLVVVITHLPGVAERLGSAIYIRKDPGGASRIIDLAAPGRG